MMGCSYRTSCTGSMEEFVMPSSTVSSLDAVSARKGGGLPNVTTYHPKIEEVSGNFYTLGGPLFLGVLIKKSLEFRQFHENCGLHSLLLPISGARTAGVVVSSSTWMIGRLSKSAK